MKNIVDIEILERIKSANLNYSNYFISRFSRYKSKKDNELSKFIQSEVCKDLYISMSHFYKKGCFIDELSGLSESVKKIKIKMPEISHLYHHQELTIKSILKKNNTIISAGTGAGKTEAFIIPIIDHCIQNNSSGVKAVLIYPMKALARDQFDRICKLIKKLELNDKVSCGNVDGDVSKDEKLKLINNPPDILITNYAMLDRMLLDPKYKSFFSSNLGFVVVDEIHYYRGIQAIDVSTLIKRLTASIKKQPIFIGSSATLTSKDEDLAILEIKEFAENFFGSKFEEESIIIAKRSLPEVTDLVQPKKIFNNLDQQQIFEQFGISIESQSKYSDLGKCLLKDSLFFLIVEELNSPKSISEIIHLISKKFNFHMGVAQDLLFGYIKAIILAENPNTGLPLAKIQIHNLVKTIYDGLFGCIDCGKIFGESRTVCDCGKKSILEIFTCRNCGEEYYSFPVKSSLPDRISGTDPISELASNELIFEKNIECDGEILLLSKKNIGEGNLKVFYSLKEGNLGINSKNPEEEIELFDFVNYHSGKLSKKNFCPVCNHESNRKSRLIDKLKIHKRTAATVFFDEIFYALPKSNKKLLVFIDNIKEVSNFSYSLEKEHNNDLVKKIIFDSIKLDNKPKSIKEVYYDFKYQMGRLGFDKKVLNYNELAFFQELSVNKMQIDSLERNNLIVFDYRHLNRLVEDSFVDFEEFCSKDKLYLIYYKIVNKMRQLGGINLIPFGVNTGLGYFDAEVTFYLEDSFENTKRMPFFTKQSRGEIVKLLKSRLSDEEYASLYSKVVKKLKLSGIIIGENGDYQLDAENILLGLPEKIYYHKNSGSYTTEIIDLEENQNLEEISFNEYLKKISFLPIGKLINDSNNLTKLKTGESHSRMNKDSRKIQENNFKEAEADSPEEQIDVMASTSTLELGIDIGDLIGVGLVGAPPTSAAYLQRIGRAGRKYNFSIVNVLLTPDPVNMYYFDNASELIDGQIETTKTDYLNKYIIKNHFNSIIISRLLRSLEDTLLDSTLNNIISKKPEIINLLKELILREDLKEILNEFKKVVGYTIDLNDALEKFIQDFTKLFDNAESDLDELTEKEKHLNERINQSVSKKELNELTIERNGVTVQKGDLQKLSFFDFFREYSFIPSYGFSRFNVNFFDPHYKKIFDVTVDSVLRSYFPKTNFMHKKRIYEINKTRVDHSENITFCPKCNAFSSIEQISECPYCKNNELLTEEFVLPKSMVLRELGPNTLSTDKVNFDYMINSKSDKIISKKQFFDIEIKSYEDLAVTLLSFGIESGDVYYCKSCEKTFKGSNHPKPLCESPEVSPLQLYNNFYTKGIELDFSKANLNKIQLVTLKNAILNTSSILFGFEETELDGVVSDLSNKIFIFDNFEGGTGYAYTIANNIEKILLKAKEIIENPKDKCEKGCLKCLYSYWRKGDIKYIDKRSIIQFLRGLDIESGN